ncbi:MAG TPA: aminotransferase class I/II-fold pyridoxal phosphate-dependent enzyme [Anaerolineales bacterium]|nr:aminotransferase class I/II-fold pyridoxal phosphate-dependent enzyme [Anaerolineales bacterium]
MTQSQTTTPLVRRPTTSKRLAQLPPYFFHKLNARLATLAAAGHDVIRMDAGSPDLPPAPHIIAALEESARNPGNHGYQSYNGTPAYRDAWREFYAERFGVQLADSEVTMVIGAKEGVFNLSQAYLDPGDISLVPDPGYAPYAAGARFAGAEVFHLPLRERESYLPDLEAIPAEALKRAKLLWLNYPNNPTGAVATPEFFERVVRFAATHGLLVAHDAPYTEITYDGYVAPSILQAPGALEVAIEFHSVSKTYNMGGWRLGAAVGNAEAVRALSTLKSNIDSGTFRGVMDAAVAALTGDQAWTLERNAQYRRRRDLAVTALRRAGLAVSVPKAAIYVWARLPEGVDDVAWVDGLLEQRHVSLTPGSIFGPAGRGYVRLSLCLADARLEEAAERIGRYDHRQSL